MEGRTYLSLADAPAVGMVVCGEPMRCSEVEWVDHDALGPTLSICLHHGAGKGLLLGVADPVR